MSDQTGPTGAYAYDSSNNLLGQALLPVTGGINTFLSVMSLSTLCPDFKKRRWSRDYSLLISTNDCVNERPSGGGAHPSSQSISCSSEHLWQGFIPTLPVMTALGCDKAKLRSIPAHLSCELFCNSVERVIFAA